MVGWYHRLKEHEFEQTLGDSEGQGSLVCCSPRGFKEWDTTEGTTEQQQLSRVCGLFIRCGHCLSVAPGKTLSLEGDNDEA